MAKFETSQLLFSFLQNSGASFDYDAGALGAKGIALGGISTNRIVRGATLVKTAESQTLSIEVDTEFIFTAVLEGDSIIRLKGMLVATRLNLPTIASIELKDQKVVLHVSDAGSTPRVDSSNDLRSWTTRTPERSGDAEDAILTLPVSGAQEFFRVAK